MEMIQVRKVWASNLVREFNYMKRLLPNHPLVSFDTEFPGTVYPLQSPHQVPPPELYESVKRNVNTTNIIQIGITLSNGKSHYVWEFNFKDFDLSRGDIHNPDSIKLLRNQGIDFEKNAKKGIASQDFVYLMLCSGLLRNSKITWIGFHIGYDCGYLIKMLHGGKLPNNLSDFLHAVRYNFGGHILDMKHMIKYCDGLYGGLETVARILRVERSAGKCHEAGSDSLLTLQTFLKMRRQFFVAVDMKQLHSKYSCMINGLELNLPPQRRVYYYHPTVLYHHPTIQRIVYCHPVQKTFHHQLIRC